MKHILTTTILAAAACAALADDRSIPEKARDAAGTVVDKTKEVARDAKDAVVGAARHAGRAARVGWGRTTAYASDDLPVYRGGANATLAALAQEIADVKAQMPNGAPAYFRTRLLALDEQHDYIAKRLAQFSPEQLKDRSSGPRYDFDQSVGDLEHAIDQAREGVETISKIVAK